MKLLPYITAPFAVTGLTTPENPTLYRARWESDKKTVRLTPEL